MQLECSLQIVEKHPNIKFHENPCNGSRVVPCGRIDRHDEGNSGFSQFCERALQDTILSAFTENIRKHVNTPFTPTHKCMFRPHIKLATYLENRNQTIVAQLTLFRIYYRQYQLGALRKISFKCGTYNRPFTNSLRCAWLH
jgi:hypothetical protein